MRTQPVHREKHLFSDIWSQQGRCLQRCTPMWINRAALIYTSWVPAHFFQCIACNHPLKGQSWAFAQCSFIVIAHFSFSNWNMTDTKETFWFQRNLQNHFFSTEQCLNLFSFSDSKLLFTFCITKLPISQALAIPAMLRVLLRVSRLDENISQAEDDTYMHQVEWLAGLTSNQPLKVKDGGHTFIYYFISFSSLPLPAGSCPRKCPSHAAGNL